MIRAVLWDNDGVLVDTEPLYFESTREVLAEEGVTLTRELFMETNLRRGQSLLELVPRAAASAEAKERLRLRRGSRYRELIGAGVELKAGVEDCLGALHGRLPMACVTTSERDNFELIHADTGVLRFFEFVLVNGDYAHVKPHPAPYLAAAERLGLRPEECLVVEDTPRGLESATRAGMRCLVIPNELTRGFDFSDAHAVLDHIREVPAHLDALLGA